MATIIFCHIIIWTCQICKTCIFCKACMLRKWHFCTISQSNLDPWSKHRQYTIVVSASSPCFDSGIQYSFRRCVIMPPLPYNSGNKESQKNASMEETELRTFWQCIIYWCSICILLRIAVWSLNNCRLTCILHRREWTTKKLSSILLLWSESFLTTSKQLLPCTIGALDVFQNLFHVFTHTRKTAFWSVFRNFCFQWTKMFTCW